MVDPADIQKTALLETEAMVDEFTWHIHLQGLVQGVGFRPYVYQLATQKRLVGNVSNGLDGLHIRLNSDKETALNFRNVLLQHPPLLAQITRYHFHQEARTESTGFTIVEDMAPSIPNLWITPDLAMCPVCKGELYDPQNRRYQYPFITCTQCGPRYSIMQSLPFERHLTAMDDFPMCHDCQQEYDAPIDRRFYAQTISCTDCGVKMEIYDANGDRLDVAEEKMISFIIQQLRAGKTIAAKGIGGFLLMVDASNATAIQTLRNRKHRPAKPFAILYPTLSALKKDTELTDGMRLALQSKEAPIVLIPISEIQHAKLATHALAPGLDTLGIMLPYAPLLELMANGFGKPLVATSANISGSPILFDNESALQELKEIADFILVHNRFIVAPQDDSVLSFSSQNEIPILLRRSRGWAPAFPQYNCTKGETILATGALLKSSFTIAHQRQVYISQYIGSTESYEAQQAYRHTLHHLQQLLHATPSVILTDKHPQYFSHELANEIAATLRIPCISIQHHKAHFAAILGEYGLQKNTTPVLGVVWDGTGIGDDGNSWGGEFFLYEHKKINRLQHIGYFPYLLGDKMAKEPRMAALSLLHHAGITYDKLQEKFTETEWNLYQKMLQYYDGIMTSSVGRLFDAVACLILGIDKQSYEGEAAMLLEVHGRRWCHGHGYDIGESYFTIMNNDVQIPTAALCKGIMTDVMNGKDKDFMAAKFHFSLGTIIESIAAKQGVKNIACTGGVFQNSLLVDMVYMLCSKKYRLYFHKHLSPNDENISFGQLVYYDQEIDKMNQDEKKTNNTIH